MIQSRFLAIYRNEGRGKGFGIQTIFSDMTWRSRSVVLVVRLMGVRSESGRNTMLVGIRRETETIISIGHILKINNKNIEEQSS